ncbi:MFS transporter [Streptomyces sp. NPDC060027]|uniref:MFS transporter n=1 Tax=Streptomyces sp. NPDC060027 TaxID=3347040 RepID=UPI0036935B42
MYLTSVGINGVGSGMTRPLLLIYFHGECHFPLSVATLIIAIGPLVSLVGNPIGGYLADRFGAAPSATCGYIAAGLGMGVMGTLSAPWQVMMCMAAVGFGISITTPARDTLLTEIVSPTQLPRYFSLTSLISQLGLGVGALIASVAMGTSPSSVFWIMFAGNCISYLLAAVFTLFVVRATRTESHFPESSKAATRGIATGFSILVQDRWFMRIWIINATAVALVFSQLSSGFPAYITTETTMPACAVSVAYLANTSIGAIMQLPVLKVMNGVSDELRLRTLCLVISAPCLLLLLAGELGGWLGMLVLMIAAAVMAVGENVHAATVPGMVSRAAPAHMRGRYAGALVLAYTVGSLIGPIMASLLLVQQASVHWLIGSSVMCIVCAAIAKAQPKRPASPNGATGA